MNWAPDIELLHLFIKYNRFYTNKTLNKTSGVWWVTASVELARCGPETMTWLTSGPGKLDLSLRPNVAQEWANINLHLGLYNWFSTKSQFPDKK